MEDLFEGNSLSAWKDDEWVYLSFPYCTTFIPIEEFPDLMEDLSEFVKKWKEPNG